LSSRQLALDLDASVPPHRPVIDNAFNVYVAPPAGQPEPSGPLPVFAPCAASAVAQAAVIAGVPEDRCLALRVREGDWSDRLMGLLDEASRRAEADLQHLRGIHAEVLGCSVEELDARMAAEKATEDARRAEARSARPKPERRLRSAPAANSAIGSRRLTDRERELVSLLKVASNVAIYQPEETIPDWSLLKDVMRALGGSWKTGGKKAKGGFRFADDVDAAEIVRLAVATGEILDARAAEFFETSDALADELVAYLNVEAFGRYLEPSAGKGAIAQAILRVSPGANVSCVEAFPPHRKALEEQGLELIGEDFLRLSPDDVTQFDGIAMNPPFGKQADIHHILWASKFLKTGGRVAAIASAGVAYRDDRLSREFRAWVESNGGTITDNPDGSFLHAGTGVRTVMVRVTIGGGQ
jgi:predicted RNA methylase